MSMSGVNELYASIKTNNKQAARVAKLSTYAAPLLADQNLQVFQDVCRQSLNGNEASSSISDLDACRSIRFHESPIEAGSLIFMA